MLDDITINNVMYIYEKEISKHIKNKRKLYDFEINKIQYVTDIVIMLKNGIVGHNKYNIFLISEPKKRLVMSLPVKDKVINHFVTRYILEARLNKYLDDRNIATRKNMGTDYGVRLVKKYINILKNKYNNFYILKIDISKYFYNIDHDVLKELLVDKLDNFDYQVICKIIDSTNQKYINDSISKIIDNYKVDIPLYNTNKGLPIGNMTSQFLSIFYLYKLDHYIVHDLKLKYYVRYMDDFVIMDSDLNKLKNAKKEIEEILNREYKLKINNKKTMITNINNGFSFLGYSYKVINNKTIIKIKKSNYEKIKKRIKEVRNNFDDYKASHYQVFCTIMTYSNAYKFASNRKIIKLINKYWYEE